MPERKKKLLIVSNSSWNLFNFRGPLLKDLVYKGYELVYVASKDAYSSRLPAGLFLELHHLNARGTHVFKDFLLFRELFLIYRRERPDLILQFTIKPNFYGSLAARTLRIPCISHLTGLGMALRNSRMGSMVLLRIYAWAMKKNRIVVFHNKADRHVFTNKRLLEFQNTLVIPGSGIDTGYFKAKPEGRMRNAFTFLFAGRLLVDKGIREYMDACRRLIEDGMEARFWIAGMFDPRARNGISEGELRNWETLPATKYWGHVEDIRELYEECDVLVLPSYGEGMPKSALEAMSMEIPVLCSEVPGCTELVEDGIHGMRFPAKDVRALAEAMKRIYLTLQETRIQMGKQARKIVEEKFALPIILKAYTNLINVLEDACDEKAQ